MPPRKKPVSVSILDGPAGRGIVKRFSNGEILEEPIERTAAKQKTRFPYPKFSLDKTRKKSF
jgi:hypothetical protein